MSILNVEHLNHGFGDRAILKDVTFRLLKGEHVGFVGANGEGKSTFMNIITGHLQPDEGKIEWAKNIHVGYLVYLVYHAEVPDVYGYLGVVHGLEHLHDALLYMGFFFLCHSCELIDTTKLVEKAQRTKLFSLFFRQRRQRAGST